MHSMDTDKVRSALEHIAVMRIMRTIIDTTDELKPEDGADQIGIFLSIMGKVFMNFLRATIPSAKTMTQQEVFENLKESLLASIDAFYTITFLDIENETKQ